MNSGWELTIQHTSPEGLLNSLWEANLPFFGTQRIDPVTLRFCVPYRALDSAGQLIAAGGGEILSCRGFGVRMTLRRLKKRYALLVCGGLCALLLMVSNLFVWRVEVSGNETVPTGAVIRAMTAAGAGVGSFWPGFDPEALRTRLLLELPGLQWAGVSYHSGALQVTVREQREPPKVVDNDAPGHIVSNANGMVTAMEAKQGQPAVAVGDTVETGQLLISGAARSTMGTTRPVHALGTVEARTWRTLTARQPAVVGRKVYGRKKSTKISLFFRGKPINFYIGSSFSGGTCDKIIMDYHLCMEDVFALPVKITVQRYVYRDVQPRELTQAEQKTLAEAALMEMLKQLVGDGSIVTTDIGYTSRKELMTATVRAECVEEIGEEVPMTEEELRQIQMENISGDETTND